MTTALRIRLGLEAAPVVEPAVAEPTAEQTAERALRFHTDNVTR